MYRVLLPKINLLLYTYLSITMNLDTNLVSRSPTLVLVFSKLSNMNANTSFNLENLSTSAENISSRLNGQATLVVVTPD